MGILKVIRNTDAGLQYMRNVLYYVLEGHTEFENRYSPNVDVFNAYEQFLLVKKYYGKTSGNPVFHFIVVYTPRSTRGDNYDIAEYMSKSIASYFSDRYQIVYGVHKKRMSKKYGGCASIYHAHFVINSVSYVDGKMFSGNQSEIYRFLEYIKNVTGDTSWHLKYGSAKDNGF